MDKETLSNYGWIVICVLVLAVMIALASPFGEYISDAVKSTTEGLFDVEQGALSAAGIDISDQMFVGNDVVNKDILKGHTAVFYGDSITAGLKTNNISFANYITEENSMALYNFGVSGYTIQHMKAKMISEESLAVLQTLSKDDYVIFAGFYNSTNSDIVSSLEDIKIDFENTGCKAKLGFVLLPTPPKLADKESRIREKWGSFERKCSEYNIPCINLIDLPTSFTSDDLHQDENGQRLLATKINTWMLTF